MNSNYSKSSNKLSPRVVAAQKTMLCKRYRKQEIKSKVKQKIEERDE